MTDDNGFTPLIYACYCGHAATAALLLDRGANIDAKDRGGMTALGRANAQDHAEQFGPALMSLLAGTNSA